jgi:hypothetical protein
MGPEAVRETIARIIDSRFIIRVLLAAAPRSLQHPDLWSSQWQGRCQT